MIKFKRVEIKNFMSYPNKTIEFNFEYMVNLIIGKNGSGKSSLIESIYYVLYGKSIKKITNSELINRINKKNMRVSIEFIGNGDEYKIVRGLKPVIFEIYKNGNRVENYNKKDMQSYLEENIININEKVFKQIVILGSDLHVPFLKLSLPERRFLIEKLFDFDLLTNMKDISKKIYKKKESELKDLKNENKIIYTKFESLKSEKERINKENEKLLKEKGIKEEELYKNLLELTNSVKSLRNSLGVYTYDEDKIIKIKGNIDDLNSKISSDKDEVLKRKDVLYQKYNSTYLELSSKLKDLKNDVLLFERDIKDKKESLISKTYVIKENEELLNENAILKTNRHGLDKIDLFMRDKFSSLNERIHEIEINMKREIERYEFYKNNDKCDACGTIFTKEKKIAVMKEIKERLRILKESKEEPKSQLEELLNRKRKVEEDLKKSISEANKNIEKIKKSIDIDNEKKRNVILSDIEILNEKRDVINKEYKNVENEIVKENSNWKFVSDEIKVQFEKNTKKYEDERLKLTKDLEECEKRIKEREDIKRKIEFKLKDIDYIKGKINEVKTIQLFSDEEVKSLLKENKKEYSDRQKVILKHEKYLKYVEVVIDIFSDNGVRSVLIKKYLPVLNSKMNEFLNEFGCDYSIEFDNNLDTVIKSRGEEINYNSYSSGQRQRMNLAILFTFVDFIKLKHSVNCNILFFDEVLDTSLDEEGVDVFFKLLNRFSMKENYSTYVVSHRESNVNYFENIYRVKMENKFSSIEKVKV